MEALLVVLTGVLGAKEPADKEKVVKPQWQRLLQGEDAKKAEDYEKKLTELEDAGQYAEALKVTEDLVELRTKAARSGSLAND
jgi:hypothetical protein